VRTPICLDESITSARAAADAIARGACSVVNIKAGRVGGYLEARKVHDVCAAHGVPVWCGGMLETGLGRAANVALAGLPAFSLPGDISASDRYWRTDITTPFVLENGHIRVPTGPGLGVRPLPDVLKAVTTSVREVAWGG
jgi:O-succinylbenzoate synthase